MPETAWRVELQGGERMIEVDPLTASCWPRKKALVIFPAKHFVTIEKLQLAIKDIQDEVDRAAAELETTVIRWKPHGKRRTMYDLR